MYVAGDDFVSG